MITITKHQIGKKKECDACSIPAVYMVTIEKRFEYKTNQNGSFTLTVFHLCEKHAAELKSILPNR